MNSNEIKEQQKLANQAVFIGTGEDITSQYLDVLNYCKEKIYQS